jgi:pimeloyl-ACP methyl ester carboxylesterase
MPNFTFNKSTLDFTQPYFCHQPSAFSKALCICIFVTLALLACAFNARAEAIDRTQDQGSFVVEVRGSGKPIILIPGLMSDASVYDGLAKRLEGAYELHILAVKGFATTPQDGVFSLEDFVNDIASYIEFKQLDKPHIIGHSMGGLSAFVLAHEHEASIGKVISIDGLPFIGPIFTRSNATSVEMLSAQASNFKTMFANMSAAQLAAQAQQGVFIQASALEDQARIIDMARNSDPKTVANAMYDVMQTDMRLALTEVKTEMLMLGASGAFTDATQHEQVASLYKAQFAKIPSAKVVMNTDVRHFMMFDDLSWLTKQITSFLGEQS